MLTRSCTAPWVIQTGPKPNSGGEEANSLSPPKNTPSPREQPLRICIHQGYVK